MKTSFSAFKDRGHICQHYITILYSIYIFYFSLCALLLNLSANLILIPRYPEYSMFIASWTTLAAFLVRIVIELIIIDKKYKIRFNYRRLLIYLFIVINPFILYLGNQDTSIMKFGFKLIYFALIVKLLANKEVIQKIKGISGKLKRRG